MEGAAFYLLDEGQMFQSTALSVSAFQSANLEREVKLDLDSGRSLSRNRCGAGMTESAFLGVLGG